MKKMLSNESNKKDQPLNKAGFRRMHSILGKILPEGGEKA